MVCQSVDTFRGRHPNIFEALICTTTSSLVQFCPNPPNSKLSSAKELSIKD